jgi:hypothetical protein
MDEFILKVPMNPKLNKIDMQRLYLNNSICMNIELSSDTCISLPSPTLVPVRFISIVDSVNYKNHTDSSYETLDFDYNEYDKLFYYYWQYDKVTDIFGIDIFKRVFGLQSPGFFVTIINVMVLILACSVHGNNQLNEGCFTCFLYIFVVFMITFPFLY